MFLKIGGVFCVELMFEFGAFFFVVFHFFVPKVVKVIHFLLVGLVDLMHLVFVSDFHFVHSALIQLFPQLLGLDSVVLGIDIIAIFLILGHCSQDLIQL